MTPVKKYQYVPKHDMKEFKSYNVYCRSCEAGWDMRTRPATEVWCPFCEADEPCQVRKLDE